MTTLSTADLYDERGAELQSLSVQLQSVGGKAQFEGEIRTVRCLEDNALVRQVLATPGAGKVLVVDGGLSLRSALLGDLIAASAIENGWEGVVIFGAVRDRVTLGTLPLGVKALGSNPRKSTKTGAGALDETLVVDSVTFRPGAHIYCDEDGVLVER
ncbi:ribonuclease E activity regulator RraA [Subtercola lobariae]|uniref:4-hydroxy-4-methyl-2-oxoglutarate aldolase n=1 Tax=Subtercola lobariae TaxID=1588641 RepID=A0A917B3L6_9MICO|nr:ribonuclease E activity regulator RraA [Subtercola lobariae]GGF21146.1 putative 4-hydroxy-4-methyl-2-oxoglutarate aldolase [Subtercola lobariae]